MTSNVGTIIMIKTVGYVFYLLCLAFISDVSTTMIFRRIPHSTVVTVGDNVTLECTGHSTDPDVRYVCSWQKDGSVVFVGEGIRKKFYNWAGDVKIGNCSIDLYNVEVGLHHGRWTCTVINSEALNEHAVTQAVRVTVLAAPTYPEIQDTSGNTVANLTVIEGRIKQLHCLSRHGNPAATLSWFLNSDDITANATFYNNSEPTSGGHPTAGYTARTYTAGSWLPLIVNRTHDGATLRCTARHEAFTRNGLPSVQLRLNIVYPPVNVSEDLNVTTSMDEPLYLECPLKGKPEPNYTWYWLGSEGNPIPVPVGFNRLLQLNNVSLDGLSGGYMCSASNLLDRENHTAFSGIFIIVPTNNLDSSFCDRDDIAFSLAVILGACALLSLSIEITLLVYFRKHSSDKGPVASNRSTMHNTFYELYQTRGRKMALVHVRSEQDSKGGKGFSLHLSSSLVSFIMVFVDLITIGTCASAIFFCFYTDSCTCAFGHPSIIVTIAFGSLVILCQLLFLTSFCIRKKEDSKYKTYARNKEDVAGSAPHSAPKSIKSIPSRNSGQSRKKEAKDIETTNGRFANGGGEVPGSVPI